MSRFPNYASSLSKFHILHPNDIVPEHNVSILANSIGNHLFKSQNIATCLKPVLQSIHDRIPLIAGGQQPILKVDYNKITSLSGTLNNAISEQDKQLPENLKLSPVFKTALTKLDKFNEFLPHLITSTAPTYQQHISELQKLFEEVIGIFNKITSTISQAIPNVSKTAKPIASDKMPTIQNIVAIISIIDCLIIDLNFLNAAESVKENSQSASVSSWIKMLEQVSQKLFTQVQSSNTSNASEVISQITKSSPSLISVVSLLEPTATNPIDFVHAAEHTISLMQLSFALETETTNKIVLDLISLISETYLNNKDLNEMLNKAKIIHKKTEERVSEGSFICFGNNAQPTKGTLSSLLEICPKENNEIKMLAITSIIRFYAMTVSNFEVAENILLLLSLEIAKILKMIFDSFAASISKLFNTYQKDLSVFNEKLLGQISYHVFQINSIKSLDVSSALFIPTVHKAFSSIGSIPGILTNVISTCSNDQAKKVLVSEFQEASQTAFKFSKWMNQYLLSVSGSIQLRSEIGCNTLNYLNDLGIKLPENAVKSAKAINDIFQSAPQYILLDISQVIALGTNFENIRNCAQEINSVIATQETSPVYPLLYKFVRSLKIFGTEFKNHALQISTILKFDESPDFVASLTAHLAQLVQLISEAQLYFKRDPKVFAFFFAIPFSGINTVCSTIINNTKFAGTLINFPTTAKISLDVVWPIAGTVASGTCPRGEENSLIVYTNSFPRLLADTLTTVGNMPQPCDEINIPEELRELKKFDRLAGTLPASLKQYSDIILGWIRNENITGAREVALKWFQAVRTPSSDYITAAQQLMQPAIDLQSKSEQIESIFDCVCFLSASLGANEPSFEKYTQFIQKQHKALLSVVRKMLGGEKHMSKASLKLVSAVVQVTALKTFKDLKLDQYQNTYIKVYRNVILQLKHSSNHPKNPKITLSAVQAINKLFALDAISQLNGFTIGFKTEELARPLIKSLMSKKESSELIQPIIEKLSNKLLDIVPNAISDLSSNKIIDMVIDKMYEKLEIFRNCANDIIKESNIKEASSSELVEIIQNHNKSVLEATALTYHGLILLKLQETQVSENFVEGVAAIFAELSPFDSRTLRINKSSQSMNTELRQLNRNLARQLDSFVNLIENPPKPEKNDNDFQKKIMDMMISLCDVYLDLANLATISLIAVVPEMYVKYQPKLSEKFQKSYNIYKEKVNIVKAKSLGPTSIDMAGFIVQIDSFFNNIVESSSNIDFSVTFPQSDFLKAISGFGESSTRLCKVVPTLTDVLHIDPDPASAAKISQNFEIPTNAKIGKFAGGTTELDPIEILTELSDEKSKLEKEIADARKVFNDQSASSDAIVNTVSKMDKVSLDYALYAKQIIAACRDQRLSELQTAIFAFGSTVTNLHVSARKRLLREGSNFDTEISDGLAQFESQVKIIIDLAEKASKKADEAPDSTGQMNASDNVTRELQATAEAINEMNARLAKFSAQINISIPDEDEFDEKEEAIHDKTLAQKARQEQVQKRLTDLNSDKGSLPAFVISNASPVLDATSQILQRAQEITKEKLKEQGGRLQNEEALIKCANDLSEAAELLLIVADILINKTEQDTEYKVISAAKIIKASVAAFVAKILKLGGDQEGKMNMFTKTVVKHADAVVAKGESIAKEKIAEIVAKTQKKTMNKFTERLNIQSDINKLETQLLQEEDALKQFNKKF